MMRLLLPSLLLAAATPAAAQTDNGVLHDALGLSDDWTVSGTFRPRIEAIDGQFRPGAARDDVLLSARTTLFVEYRPGDWFVGGEVWDVRGYLEQDNSSIGTGEVNALEPIQAYAGRRIGDAGRLTVGRWTQDLGSRRFLARQRFRNTTNAFTGAKLELGGGADDEMLLFWSMPQRRLPDSSERIRDNAVVLDSSGLNLQFFGGSFTRKGVAGGSLQLYAFGTLEDDTDRFATRNRQLFTPGLRLFRAPAAGRFDHEIELTYQTGETRRTTAASDVTPVAVSAYLLHAEAGRTLAGGIKPRLAIGYDLASGDGGARNRFTRFDNLFGARRQLGPTDLYGALTYANLNSPFARVSVTPAQGATAFVEYRPAFLQDRRDSFAATGVRDAAGSSGDFGGHQVETALRLPLADVATLETGAVYLAKGRFLREAPNAPRTGDTLYGYLDVTFAF